MNTNILQFPLIIIGVAAFAGCATPFRAPSDVAHIQLEQIDSPIVRVEKVRLERKESALIVTGYVVKRLDVKDTSRTHLDVTLLDADGRTLRETVEHFEPRQIPRRYRRPDSVTYRITLDPLPAGTARIVVRAHEGTHS